MHLLKHRGGAYAGDWVIEKAGSCRLGCGLVQQATNGPIDRAGFTNGLKKPEIFGPKTDPVRRPKTQKFKCGMKESGPVFLGPKQSEPVKSPKAQKQG